MLLCEGIPHTGGWDTDVGRSSYNRPKRRILIENPLTGKECLKKSGKSEFNEFASMEKYAQVLLIERIRQSQKFGKVVFYHLK
jgi:hypothetical protein